MKNSALSHWGLNPQWVAFRDGNMVPCRREEDGALPFFMLGEAGRGRRLTPVAIHPAAINAPTVRVGTSRTGRPKIIPAPEGAQAEAVLLRLSCSGAYIRGAWGRNVLLKGQCELVATGHGAFGAAGRVGTWDDDLVIASPGSVFVNKPSRGEPRIVVVKDDLTVIKFDTVEEYLAAVDIDDTIPYADPTGWRDMPPVSKGA